MRRRPGELTDLELAILRALEEHPEHRVGRRVWGYLLLPEVARTGGLYKALARLERAGLVRGAWDGRRKRYGLTEEGLGRI
jgi:DNA-binding PadR family transcriptional regulator